MTASAVTSERGRAVFAATPGWAMSASTFPWGDDVGQVVFASSVPIVGDDGATGWPINTVRQLPGNGIVICASMAPSVQGGAVVYPERALPLKLTDGTFLTGQYEDQAAANVSLYRLATQIGDEYVTIEVFFGTPSPDATMMQAAEAQLATFAIDQAAAVGG
jgi:hypothetical protein